MLVYVHGAKCVGIQAVPVTVEVDITLGIGIHLVGLADAAVKESLLRTVTSLQAKGFRIPGKKIVINLAPADLHKQGSGYDLPIALGIIAASEQRSLPGLEKYLIMGELGLDGSIRYVAGTLPMVELAVQNGFKGAILPERSALEAVDFDETMVFGVRTLDDVLRILEEKEDPSDLLIWNTECYGAALREERERPVTADYMDFADILGQESAKRGVEIAAAGGHNLIMFWFFITGAVYLQLIKTTAYGRRTKAKIRFWQKLCVCRKNFNEFSKPNGSDRGFEEIRIKFGLYPYTAFFHNGKRLS